jgi:hypothetical protein
LYVSPKHSEQPTGQNSAKKTPWSRLPASTARRTDEAVLACFFLDSIPAFARRSTTGSSQKQEQMEGSKGR